MSKSLKINSDDDLSWIKWWNVFIFNLHNTKSLTRRYSLVYVMDALSILSGPTVHILFGLQKLWVNIQFHTGFATRWWSPWSSDSQTFCITSEQTKTSQCHLSNKPPSRGKITEKPHVCCIENYEVDRMSMINYRHPPKKSASLNEKWTIIEI